MTGAGPGREPVRGVNVDDFVNILPLEINEPRKQESAVVARALRPEEYFITKEPYYIHRNSVT